MSFPLGKSTVTPFRLFSLAPFKRIAFRVPVLAFEDLPMSTLHHAGGRTFAKKVCDFPSFDQDKGKP
jgi:hypothetical protein